MKRLIAALWLSISLPAGAADVWGIHTLSYHAPKREFNNVNPGVYWRSEDGMQAGVLKNSFRKRTLYLGQNYEVWKADVMLGGALGYPQSPVVPLVAVSKRMNLDYNSGLRFAALGSWTEGKPGVVLHLMYEVNWRN